ncbi:GntR family transcriptional regulator [Streptomyces flaveolus]|uniref:GntR family transcriptional regulator n=1 Tax=Streptomyces flaveolus TaxID=67297 RepID=UPI0038266022
MARSSLDVYETVRSRVVSGFYPPGAHLTEAALCAELRVSRTPVRTALRQLGEEGLIRVEPNKGAFVAEYTRTDIDEVFELRKLLESRAAALAATRRTQQDVTALHESVATMVRIVGENAADRLDELHHNNRDFHNTILAAARAPRTFRMAQSLTQTSVTLGTFFSYSEEDISRSVQVHRDLARAIEHRQASLASSLMSAHLELAHTTFVARRFGEDAPG